MGANLMSLASGGGKFLKLFGDRKMMKQLPYYCEVEYLESTGTQWIDTGIAFDVFPISINMGFMKMNWTAPTDFFGTVAPGVGNYIIDEDRHAFYIRYGTNKHSGESGKVLMSTYYDIELSVSSEGVGSFVANGKTLQTDKPAFIGSSEHHTFPGRRYLGGGNVRFYFVKVVNGGKLVRDFIPVLDREMRPAMYDRVTGKLFYNKGTGEFLIGPDKAI